jgi:hypothetical protein
LDEPAVYAGQALFNAPTVLGGQAAKAGLSCASCHNNGRDNAHFELAGVSDKPGSADVTNSFFSAVRGNGRFDPVAIPDLAVPGKISRAIEAKALEPFIRSLIVEEFAGHEPSPAMLDALAAYVRAVRNCPGGEKTGTSRRLADQLLIMQGALAGAAYMADRGDWQAVDALIAAARHQLGLVSERYAGEKLSNERALLLKVSHDLKNFTGRRNSPKKFRHSITVWQSDFDKKLDQRLFQKEHMSLYNPALLRAVVAPQQEFR